MIAIHCPHQYLPYLLAAHGFVVLALASCWVWARRSHRRWLRQARLMRRP